MGDKGHSTGIGSMIGIHFTPEKPRDARYAQLKGDRRLARSLFKSLLDSGIIYLTQENPHLFISAAHTQEDIEALIQRIEDFAKTHSTL